MTSLTISNSEAEAFQIQRDRTTKSDRYPNIFSAVRHLLKDKADAPPKILSFGCSTGEEPLSLATLYFPTSSIIGLDASPEAIAVAKSERSLQGRIVYDVSTPETLEKYGPYDAIFAMSVLCRWPTLENIADASELFPFPSYVKMVETLDRSLRKGGLLVIYNSHYSFSDTDLISNYEIALVPTIRENGYVKHFDREGREIVDYIGTETIYRKFPDAPNLSAKVLRFIDESGRPIGRLCARERAA